MSLRYLFYISSINTPQTYPCTTITTVILSSNAVINFYTIILFTVLDSAFQQDPYPKVGRKEAARDLDDRS